MVPGQPSEAPAPLTAEQVNQLFAADFQRFLDDFAARTGYLPHPVVGLNPLIVHALRLANAPTENWPVTIHWVMMQAGDHA